MDNKLNIRKDSPGTEQRIFLEGRLDANWAGHLDDYLNNLVRDGSYRIILNMSGIQYLSSAGIRVLVIQYKNIKRIGGVFQLEALSDAVAEVLEMVGLLSMLTEKTAEAPTVSILEDQSQEVDGYRFDHEMISEKEMEVGFRGNPDLILSSGYTADENSRIKFKSDEFGLGIGAIGDGFEDCKSRYGEFLAVGDALAYKPSDGSRIPDYSIKTGRLEPEIDTLYALLAKGTFSSRISFEPLEKNRNIPLEALISGFAKVSEHNQFVFLMVAENTGLVGVSLNAPPVGGKQLFQFPDIREYVNFTTEPAYPRMLTITLGFYSKEPGEMLKTFLRPVNHKASGYLHAHSAVFPYQALPKQITEHEKLVVQLFETSIVQDVLHLINDSREIVGLGDSTFKQGVAWIGKFS